MNDFQRYLAEEFVEDYQEGRLTRREALKLIASVMGSLVLANSFLAACTAPPPATLTSAPTSAPPPTRTPALSPSPTSRPTIESSGAPTTVASSSPTPVVSGTVS